mmetsp:Transcript_60926/g.109697  ORF Transcript_60926/g.109697 Transcript_60926/m.109697 type:complete len:82 (-) Transcript_60926:258-503(-)
MWTVPAAAPASARLGDDRAGDLAGVAACAGLGSSFRNLLGGSSAPGSEADRLAVAAADAGLLLEELPNLNGLPITDMATAR